MELRRPRKEWRGLGTYYATMVDGIWSSQRVTKTVGLPSLALDPGSGRVHVMVGKHRLHEGTVKSLGVGKVAAGVEDPEMRVDPATGSLLLVYVRSSPDGESDGLIRHYQSMTPSAARGACRAGSGVG
jgi:hypothetical protein